ncbi:YjgN family protein [Lactobacillus acidophilus]|nr:YjgN family protein [Lactobacillus acidophilus]
MEIKHGRNSFFDGGLLSLIGCTILGTLVTVFTLGICYPWAICMMYGWRINHTVIEGRRLEFFGSAWSLFGNWIKWLLLSIITLGIYSFWVRIKLYDWKAKYTIFRD